ncbi:MAG: hypothetical protein IPP30_11390 [Flavobacterium sp.]|nr:hypothetical protein [Flavobacterium sp.]
MKKILILLFFTIALASCSSGSDSDSSSSTGVLLTKIVLESESGTRTTTYVYNGNKMNTISNGSTVSYFYYSGNLVSNIESFYNNQLMSVFTFDYNNAGKLVQSKLESFSNDLVIRDTFIYNDDNTISVNEYGTFEGGPETLQTQKYFLDSEGEIIRIEKNDGSGTAVSLYTYDTKNNPFKNVLGFDKLFNIMSLGIKHNTVTTLETDFDGSTISSTEKKIIYNAQDYPVTMQYEGASSIEHYYY